MIGAGAPPVRLWNSSRSCCPACRTFSIARSRQHGEERLQRRHGAAVDQRHLGRRRHLDELERRHVGALADELGVEREARRLGELLAHAPQGGVAVDVGHSPGRPLHRAPLVIRPTPLSSRAAVRASRRRPRRGPAPARRRHPAIRTSVRGESRCREHRLDDAARELAAASRCGSSRRRRTATARSSAAIETACASRARRCISICACAGIEEGDVIEPVGSKSAPSSRLITRRMLRLNSAVTPAASL